MATYYLVGSSGNWQGGNIWATSSGGAASVQTPTSADDVVFDTHSTGTVTIGTASNCHNLTMTAPGAGTITRGGSAVLNVYGSMTLASGMTFAPLSSAVINFLGTTTGLTVTHAGYLLPLMNYNGVGGEWTWQDNQTNLSNSALTITLTNGSLITGGFSAGAANGVSLSSSNSNIRSLTLGATTWKLNPTQSAAIWDLGTTTNLTFSGASSTITLGGVSTFNGGGLTYGTVTGTQIPGGAGSNFINGANTFATLTLSCAATDMQNFSYQLSADQIVTGTFTANGSASTVNTRNYITSNVKGTQRTITAATVVASYLNLQDIKGAGAATWDLSAITGNSGDCGGNTGITFTPAANIYYHNTSSGSANWSNSAKWFAASNGAGGSARVPLPQDTAIFDSASFTTGSITVNNDMWHLPAVNWTGVTNSPTFQNTTNAFMFGDMVLAAGMSLSSTSSITFEKRGALTVNTAGLTIPWPLILNSVTGVGTWPITAAIATSNTFLLTSGTVNLSNQLSVTGITLAGGATTDAGASGEYKGTTFSCTAGTHTLRKLTLSSTFAQSGGSITVPALGTITWGTASTWTWTPNTFVFTTGGIPTWTGSSLVVAAAIVPGGSGGGSWLSC